MLVEVWGYDSSVWSGHVAAGAWAEACRLQRPLPDGSLQVVLWGEKQNGAMELAKIWLGRQPCRTRGCPAARWGAGSAGRCGGGSEGGEQ